MKYKIYLFHFILFCLLFLPALKAQNLQSLFQNANTYYQQKQYEEAVRLYLQLIEKDKNNVNAHFNLGNSYFHLKKYSDAVLQYEKAGKLEPDNKYILHNIQLTNNKLFTKMELSKEFFVTQSVRNFIHSKSSRSWSILLIVFIWIGSVAMCLFFYNKKSIYKTVGILSLLAGITFSFFTFKSYHAEHKNNFAIVMRENVLLKKTPVENANTTDTLFPGTKVELLDIDKKWYNIKLPNDKTGWVENDILEKI